MIEQSPKITPTETTDIDSAVEGTDMPDGVESEQRDDSQTVRALGGNVLRAAKAPMPGEIQNDTYAEELRNISEHPKVVDWLRDHDNAEKVRSDIVVAATKRALSSESVVSMDELVSHELRTLPSGAEQASGVLRHMERSFDNIGVDIQKERSGLGQMLESIMRGHGADTEGAIAKVRRLQYRVEDWTSEARHQGYQSEELAAFTNQVVDKTKAIMGHAGSANTELRDNIGKVNTDTEESELTESAYDEINQAQASNAEEFIEGAAQDEERVYGLFGELGKDAERLSSVAQPIGSGANMKESLLRFPQTTNQMRHDVDVLERGMRSGNMRQVEAAGREIIRQLGLLEEQARNIRVATANGQEKLTEAEDIIDTMQSSMRGAREYFRA